MQSVSRVCSAAVSFSKFILNPSSSTLSRNYKRSSTNPVVIEDSILASNSEKPWRAIISDEKPYLVVVSVFV